MSFELKYSANGTVELRDGKPVFIDNETNNELVLDANDFINKQHSLREESKQYRIKAEDLEKKLKGFDGISVEEAKKNAELVRNMKETEAIKNGEIEALKSSISKTAAENERKLKEAYEAQLSDLTTKLVASETKFKNSQIDNAFFGSEYIKENTVIPAEMLKATYGKYFQFDENGSIYGVDLEGNKILSSKNVTRVAGFEEAIQKIIEADPNKDRILKAKSKFGGGMQSGSNGKIPANIWNQLTDSSLSLDARQALAAQYGLDSFNKK